MLVAFLGSRTGLGLNKLSPENGFNVGLRLAGRHLEVASKTVPVLAISLDRGALHLVDSTRGLGVSIGLAVGRRLSDAKRTGNYNGRSGNHRKSHLFVGELHFAFLLGLLIDLLTSGSIEHMYCGSFTL
jgi:hypothetical protein